MKLKVLMRQIRRPPHSHTLQRFINLQPGVRSRERARRAASRQLAGKKNFTLPVFCCDNIIDHLGKGRAPNAAAGILDLTPTPQLKEIQSIKLQNGGGICNTGEVTAPLCLQVGLGWDRPRCPHGMERQTGQNTQILTRRIHLKNT